MEQLLQQLKDIHLPNEPTLWPLAWGWWLILSIVICLILALTAYTIYKRLKVIQWDWQRWENEPDEHKGVLAIAWLKQAALLRFNREEIARLSGTDWIDFLQENGIECNASIAHWISIGYLVNHPPPEEATLWLKRALLKISGREIVLS